MGKNFKDYYLTESAKEYTYKLKFAVNEFTSDMKDALEQALTKYDLRSIGAWKSTPIQENPLDFPNVRNTEVHIVEVVLGYPAASDMLRVYLCDKVGVNQQGIAVYNAKDPRDAYTEEMLARLDPTFKANYKPVMGTEYEDDGEKPLYGKAYNDKFLKELADERDEREPTIIENPLMPKQTTDRAGVAADDVGEKGGFSVLGGKK